MRGFHIKGVLIPYYGFMISISFAVVVIVGHILTKKFKLNNDNFFLLLSYCMLGAFVGAKVLYLFVSFPKIEWNRIGEFQYLIYFFNSGFVFYGGVIGAGLGAILAAKLHSIPVYEYTNLYIPILPFAHALGRVGCHLASCCYGVPYDGIGHIIYHAPAVAPVGVSLFPVQLVEAGLNIILGLFLLHYVLKKRNNLALLLYGGAYGILRFILEYWRYDISERGSYYFFSVSQWISIGIVLLSVGTYFFLRKSNLVKVYSHESTDN